MIRNLLLTSCLMMCIFNLNAQTTILDFETPATSADFQYFGGTLEGTLNSTIANPDASGINASAMVAELIKTTDAGLYGGAYTDVPTPIDLTEDSEICLKVWVAQPTQLLLKLELSTNGFSNWEKLQDINTTQTWVEVCYNTAVASDAAPSQPATDGIYSRLTLFFDFATEPAEDQTYYFDDVITKVSDVTAADVTFSVDMNDYAGSFTTAYVSGTFNDWSEDANPLADDDGDGVWTGTVTDIPLGAHEYKFQLDNWAVEEDFSGVYYDCTATTFAGDTTFVNRSIAIGENTSLPTVCYNSCYACDGAVMLTVNLGDGGLTPSDDGFFIAGGEKFGNPGDFLLTDDDGDGVHSGSFEQPLGFESYYTFTNGNCGDFSCKENIADQDCARPENFNDRRMGPLNEDTVINTCFGTCTDNTDCTVGVGDVTFEVDMNAYMLSFDTVYVSGSFNGWSQDENPMTNNGNGIWSTTIPLIYGNYEFKYQVDKWTGEEVFAGGEECTMQFGQFINRVFTVDGNETLCFLWNTCESCLVNVDDVENTVFSVQPTLVTDEAVLIFGSKFTDAKSIRIFNAAGQLICTEQIVSGTPRYVINARELPNGIYFIHIQTENLYQTQRIIVNK